MLKKYRNNGGGESTSSTAYLGSSPASSPPLNAAEEGKGKGQVHAEPSWDDEKDAENKRRIALLSESLNATDVHDLQVLRGSLERQVDEAAHKQREMILHPREGGLWPSFHPLDEDAQWHTDLLATRLAAVTSAVEKKGGWRSAVFLGGGEVNVEAEVDHWPAAEAVLMLQTVKDALYVQLQGVRMNSGSLHLLFSIITCRHPYHRFPATRSNQTWPC